MHNEESKVCFEADRYLIHNVLGLTQLPWTEKNLTKPMIRKNPLISYRSLQVPVGGEAK